MAVQPQDIIQQVAQIQDVAQLVRARRQAMGLRQEDVAIRARMSRSRLADLELNNSVDGISFRKLNDLLCALGLQLAISLQPESPPSRADVAAHKRNGIRVPSDILIRQSSIA